MTEATGQAAQIADRLLSAETRLDAHAKDLFRLRFQRSEADLFEPLEALYGGSPGYAGFREDLIAALVDLQAERPPALRHLDLRRDLEPDWFQRPDMVGYVFYIDRFAGTLRGVLDKAGLS